MPPRSTLTPSRRRADHEVVGVELERRQPRANRDVERAAGEIEHVPRDDEALERRRADPGVLACRELVDSRDVAVGHEAAERELQAIEQSKVLHAPPAPHTGRRGARRTPRKR